ncbi:MAG: hypothetical protein M0042_04725 [Nitrospiraceae bacterium]|nr:hypothetical protein [Nitrospiraceae bacterium]
MLYSRVLVFCLFVLSMIQAAPAIAADQPLKPYLLGFRGPGTVEAKLPEVKAALEQKGFQIVGEYAPYAGAEVIVATNDALKAAAAKSGFGAYGAVVRVAVTLAGKELQVASTNPRYFAAAYRMKDDLSDIAAALEQAIGKTAEFGSRDGIPAAKLRKYHYMMMMPYFDDHVKLATFPSQDEALAAVEAGLAAKKGGAAKVYRVDLPGKKESVIGVSLAAGDGADAVIMKVIDLGELKHTPHLPYELVVSDGSVYMLHGKFRIALDFPDLTMGTFMKISGAPSAIEEKLKAAAGGK